ncbi:hypothetical protein NQ318_005087 [Aromia moschata]|uniref:Uncharacterized protein n=1 Tax=Aromia moschata TaxID=1265417 RepID=A0AAV8X1E1_9CUCU|nr:hypothetical protein NQ318_005087 [Aromia moschata]
MVAEKVAKRMAALTRLMPRHVAMRIRTYKEILKRVQRRVLLGVVAAYRAVSTEALQVLADIPPIDLMVMER